MYTLKVTELSAFLQVSAFFGLCFMVAPKICLMPFNDLQLFQYDLFLFQEAQVENLSKICTIAIHSGYYGFCDNSQVARLIETLEKTSRLSTAMKTNPVTTWSVCL